MENKHVNNREIIIDYLKQELFGGVCPTGAVPLASGHSLIFETLDELRNCYCQETGEEILQREHPELRYGVGVLYPAVSQSEDTSDDEAIPGLALAEDDEESRAETVEAEGAGQTDTQEPESDDFEVSAGPPAKLSSMGFSFLLRPGAKQFTLNVGVSGGQYFPRTARAEKKTETWWYRTPFKMAETIDLPGDPSDRIVKNLELSRERDEALTLEVITVVRPYRGGSVLVTVTLVNRSEPIPRSVGSAALFQASLSCDIDSESAILPYPSSSKEDVDPEDQSMNLLYRRYRTYAVGHGCAANWAGDDSGRIFHISAEPFPVVTVPSMTSDIRDKNGSPVEFSMKELAGLVPGRDGLESLGNLCNLYEEWINDTQKNAQQLPNYYRSAAESNLTQCHGVLRKMRSGLQFLKSRPEALRAFQLTNYAILLQQIRAQRRQRSATFDRPSMHWVFAPSYEEVDLNQLPIGRGYWRGFQIAFLLSTIESTVLPEHPDRSTVDLLWFPTGGGKTEAYLGLAAFYMAYQRMVSTNSDGVNIIMRYTLRLLTTQQFQRASGLMCALEYLRSKFPELGPSSFTVGLWLGGTTTPNRYVDARDALKRLQREADSPNPFVVNQCPWCGAKMGPSHVARLPKGLPSVLGYRVEGSKVILACPDSSCFFARGLPIMVIDEQLYETPPSLLIGTVDKFAMLAWRPEAKALFGLGDAGERIRKPPGLIIQDELHLIAGPLGSMVGLYEPVLEALCTETTDGSVIAPKIITSTATIRRYRQQTESLYGRKSVGLFPPPGTDIGDSFFSHEAVEPDGTPMPQKVYVGVFAPGLSSMQTTQVRTFSALLQAPMDLEVDERDPWWTQLVFFNSLRELGTTLSLFQSDIPDRLKIMRRRLNIPWERLRDPNRILELTSRIGNSEIPTLISRLEQPATTPKTNAVDVCLASNIIEVGIDIDRLSLMVVVGQPKSTSQYIQVTGRVGRRWQERPGLVVTLLSPSKPRDRSHFEQFRSYHERLYAQVEPTSLTPFAPPTLDRGLHGAMLAYVRQIRNLPEPYPIPNHEIAEFEKILGARIDVVDSSESDTAKKVLERRKNQWRIWQPPIWTASSGLASAPLMRSPGEYTPPGEQSWVTPQSMRNVDAECIGDIRVPSSLIPDDGGLNQ